LFNEGGYSASIAPRQSFFEQMTKINISSMILHESAFQCIDDQINEAYVVQGRSSSVVYCKRLREEHSGG